MGQLSQGSGVGEHGPRDCCLVCRSPLSEVSTVTWDAILATVSLWSPHVEKVCIVTQFRLGEGGGGVVYIYIYGTPPPRVIHQFWRGEEGWSALCP